jgi:alkanesulfonate monooxygenase SsuD/methylene tetrahydromethanopterin reductase-like flavin-dependent oxidoreductase (luciferase family)
MLIPDHFMWDRSEMPDRNSTLDAWTALSYLAAKTRALRLGTLVTPIPFRPPGMLAKIVATHDVISSGRAILGVGAGWSQTEFEGYSEWTDAKTRVDKTKEGVKLILKLWQEPKIDFQGRFYKAKGAVLDPKPVQKPHPPLLFGGVSPRMLKLAGRYGDMCFIPPWAQTPFAQARSIVDKEARRLGRQGGLMYGAGSPMVQRGGFDMKALAKDIGTAADNGCQFYVTPFPQDEYEAKMREFIREVMPSYTDRKESVAKVRAA